MGVRGGSAWDSFLVFLEENLRDPSQEQGQLCGQERGRNAEPTLCPQWPRAWSIPHPRWWQEALGAGREADQGWEGSGENPAPGLELGP